MPRVPLGRSLLTGGNSPPEGPRPPSCSRSPRVRPVRRRVHVPFQRRAADVPDHLALRQRHLRGGRGPTRALRLRRSPTSGTSPCIRSPTPRSFSSVCGSARCVEASGSTGSSARSRSERSAERSSPGGARHDRRIAGCLRNEPRRDVLRREHHRPRLDRWRRAARMGRVAARARPGAREAGRLVAARADGRLRPRRARDPDLGPLPSRAPSRASRVRRRGPTR